MAIFSSQLTPFAGNQAAGLVSIGVESSKVTKALLAYAAAAEKNVIEALKLAALKTEAEIKKRTPVDTGRLKSSIHTILPGKTDSYTYHAGKRILKSGKILKGRGGKGAKGPKYQTVFDGTIEVTAGKTQAIVGTNVEYAQFINFGTGRMIGHHMFERGLRQAQQDLIKATQLALLGKSVGQFVALGT